MATSCDSSLSHGCPVDKMLWWWTARAFQPNGESAFFDVYLG
jgi:hypothetical protein